MVADPLTAPMLLLPPCCRCLRWSLWQDDQCTVTLTVLPEFVAMSQRSECIVYEGYSMTAVDRERSDAVVHPRTSARVVRQPHE